MILQPGIFSHSVIHAQLEDYTCKLKALSALMLFKFFSELSLIFHRVLSPKLIAWYMATWPLYGILWYLISVPQEYILTVRVLPPLDESLDDLVIGEKLF